MMAAVRMSHDERSEQLLDVAEQLFTSHGYDRCSIEAIATAAGVSRPVVYQHHGSKEGLLLACVARARAEFEADLLASHQAAQGDFTRFVEHGGEMVFDLLHDRPSRWKILFSSAVGESGPLAARLSDQRFTTIARLGWLAGEYAPEVDPEHLQAFAVAVSGISEALCRWSLNSPGLSKEQFLAYFRMFVLGAIRSLLAEARPGS